MSTEVFDDRICLLGEGPLWHPARGQLFWFDILGKRLLSRADDTPLSWAFDEHVSAAGWIDATRLLIASETRLMTFDLVSETSEELVALEADTPLTRSNDGRADPWGGFWIGTMGKNAEPEAGAIYRFWQGELRQLVAPVTISNAISFSPDAPLAYYSDTATKEVMGLPLHPDTGWPEGPASRVLDLRPEELNPDGAVTDAHGSLWIAEWGSGRVSAYRPNGDRVTTVAAPAAQTSCPAFGGPELQDLYITSAAIGLSRDDKAARPDSGMTFVARGVGQGRPEHRVVL